MSFVHLHNHSDFSLLDASASIDRYIEKCKENGMTSLALTDHGNMYGAVTFYKACKANDINPIVGCEFYYTKDRRLRDPNAKYYHLILLATSDKGYHNLMKLNYVAWKEGYYYKPRIDDEALEMYNEDLICLSACLSGEIPRLILDNKIEEAKERINWFKGVFGDRYYLEIQNHGLSEEKKVLSIMPSLSRETGVPLVCTNDIHYIEKEDWYSHDILLCIGRQEKQNSPGRQGYKEGEFYFRNEEEMRGLFPEDKYPGAVDNAGVIASRCNLEIKFPGPLLPKCGIPKEFSSDAEYLTKLSYDGLELRFPNAKGDELESLKERLQHELDIIIKMDFPAYFLIVREYIHWAKVNKIPVGPGRGSGAGSLVAYSIEITDVDPIKYNLLFERFLNPERVSLPDFDIDFCFERRGEVIKHVIETYGEDHVGQIVTFGTLKPKAVVKDVARVLDIPFDESNKITSLIPDEIPGIDHMHISDAMKAEPKLQEYYERGGIYKELFDNASKLENLNRHASTHAAGVVIGQEALSNYVPVSIDTTTGGLISQYPMTQIEECGLVKMDFLGLKTLTLIQHTVDLIHKKEPSFDISKIDDHDDKTFDMLKRGDSSCVFQFESSGMQDILRRAEPDSIEELVALNALYRPGPMQYIEKYIDSKKGKIPITYPDPSLEPVLKNTYGVIVYQEQVMQTAQVIAGYTLGQADILRRIMGKKKKEKLAEELVKFKKGAKENGFTEKHAEEIFHILEPFAGYGFNKSHAVAYSIIAYQTAYLKANYLPEFLAANLTNEMGNPDKFKEYLALAPRYNIKVVPPSINRSESRFSVDNGEIIYGLSGIKNIGEGFSEMIIKERERNGKYIDFMDFLSRQKENTINSRSCESLIKTGCFDECGIDRATLLFSLDEAIAFDKRKKSEQDSGFISLFGDEEEEKFKYKKASSPLDTYTKLKDEKELMGFYISGHPLDLYKEIEEACVRVNLAFPESIVLGSEEQIIGQVTKSRKTVSRKSGKKLFFFTLLTKEGEVDSVIFPQEYERLDGKVVEDGIYGFVGKFDKKDGKLSFMVNDVKDPHDLKATRVNRINIRIKDSIVFNKASLKPLSSLLSSPLYSDGDVYVSLYIKGIDDKVLNTSPSKFNLKYSQELINNIKSLSLVENVWIS